MTITRIKNPTTEPRRSRRKTLGEDSISLSFSGRPVSVQSVLKSRGGFETLPYEIICQIC